MHPDSKSVLLYDRSSMCTTRPIGDNTRPFEPGRFPRRIVTNDKINDKFAFPADVQFRIVWHDQKIDVGEQITYREDNPRLTRTVDDAPTVPSTCRVTRIHTPACGQPKIRYERLKELGKGMFGKVWKVVDVDSGEHIALKKIPWPKRGRGAPEYTNLKREVETMAALSHPNIIEFIGAQGLEVPERDAASSGDGDLCLELFIGLKEGNIKQLMKSNAFANDDTLPRRLLHDGLKGLDCLVYKNVVHRDVKPENIMWTIIDNVFVFQFTDFGLCNSISMAVTFTGSKLYMAPEVLLHTGEQTAKMDVWSFFVTLAEVFNANGYRDKAITKEAEIIPAVEDAAKAESFEQLRPMAIVDPNQRASAGDMLDTMFNGEGRTTARQSKPASGEEHSEAPRTQPRTVPTTTRRSLRRLSNLHGGGVLGTLPAAVARPSRVSKGQMLLPTKDKQPTDPWMRMAANKKRAAA